jgi:predicted MFS family arabinose efflux permease
MFGIAVCYGALWFSLNCFQGALLAVTPDRVPERSRGLASSVFGVAGPIGALVGVNIAALAPSEWGYATLAAMLLASTAAFVIFARERPWRGPTKGRPSARRWRTSVSLLGSFGSRDFSLAYAFRVLMFVAQFAINNYLLYILQDHIGAAGLPGGDARYAAGALNSFRVFATIAAIFVGYFLANRTHRRRIFGQAYALIMAIAMIVPIVSPDWTGMLIFGVLGGVAIGLYAAIDLTLMSRVLPNPDAAGRDLALLVMAGASAQFVAPLFGSLLIDSFGYDALFAAAAVVTLGAGAVMSFIRGVE